MMNVVRSQPPPESLAAETSYDGDDVKERLWEDFQAKCYLTEFSLSLGCFEIDHLYPQCEFLEKKFDWNNLHLAHPDANRRRKKWTRADQLLGPAEDYDISSRLLQWLDEKHIPRFAACKEGDKAAENTALELDHIHHDSNAKARDLRDTIVRQVAKVLEKMVAYDNSHDDTERRKLRKEIEQMTNSRAAFSTLICSLERVQDFLARVMT